MRRAVPRQYIAVGPVTHYSSALSRKQQALAEVLGPAMLAKLTLLDLLFTVLQNLALYAEA
jgi:hypothetical protein